MADRFQNTCFRNISCEEMDDVLDQRDMQTTLNKPMPYVGVYIAAASLVCCVAMVGDIIHGFRHKKFWMPSKYFTINPASLTVLAIAGKLAMDLSMDLMPTGIDGLAKYSGSVFICTAMANFIPSLGSMNDKDLLQNLVAMGILVLTLSGNMVIQLVTMFNITNAIIYGVFVFCILSQFVILSFSAIAISTTKREIEWKYHLLDKLVTGGDKQQRRLFEIETLRKQINIYWVMAETGSPKFVMSRAVTSFAVVLVCVMSTFVFGFLFIYLMVLGGFRYGGKPDYMWSTRYILMIQTIGIIAGSVAPALRSLFTVVSFCSKINVCDRNTFKVEEYWTSRLKEWKHRPLALAVGDHTCRKVILILRNLFYSFCIIIQVIIVVESKVLRFVSSLFLKPLLNCFYCIERLKRAALIKSKISSDSVGLETRSDAELEELKKYVLLLEGEVELPQKILKDICKSVKQVIKRGANEQPKKLLRFISEQPFCFNGLTVFDSEQVPSLHLEEPPRCWSLSLSNLACIAVAFPMIPDKEKISLLQTIGEGLSYTRLIEKGLDTKKILGNSGNAADILWNGVELNRKWMDKHLLSKTLKGKKNSKEVLKYFEEISKKMFIEYKGSIMDAVNWPSQLMVANSMYRISQSLLLLQENENENDEMIFKRIIGMIAEILVACLSNLPWLITSKCHSCTIEKRETSVKEAARILGATEDIIKFIQMQRLQLPDLAPEDAPYLDEWRVFRV